MEAVECGPACLAMVLGHFGRHVPLAELRQLCGASRDGVSAGGILRAAERYGLSAKGFRREAGRVLAGSFPAIALWQAGHFVVVEGAVGKHVYINDPRSGPRRLDLAEFAAGYSGILLTFDRTAEFRPAGRQAGGTTRVLALWRGHGTSLAVLGVCGALATIPIFALARLLQTLAESAGSSAPPERGLFALAIGGLALARPALVGLAASAQLRLAAAFERKLPEETLWRLLRLPASYFRQRHPGAILNRFVSSERAARELGDRLPGLAVNGLIVALLLALMATIDRASAGIAPA